ncbi:MAG: acetate--CoA ligase family protein, partial [Pseudomonadota bacterium]
GVGLAHKTEAGAVALGLGSAEAVEAAALGMSADAFLVEQQITGSVAELLVGVIADPAHGYVLTLGAGGTLTEVLGDTVSLLLPVCAEDVREALAALRLAPVLAGYRGAPAVDMQAVVDAVLAVQAYVAEARPLEVEINPLICTPDAAYAADALIRMGGSDD